MIPDFYYLCKINELEWVQFLAVNAILFSYGTLYYPISKRICYKQHLA